MVARFASDPVSSDDPEPIVSGMIGLNLDPLGHLLRFDAMPPQVEEHPPLSVPPDWKALFAAAGLDVAGFIPTEPQWISLANSDSRAAWTGSYPSAPEIPMRIEAASWRGKIVFFRAIGSWSKPERMQQPTGGDSRPPAYLVVLLVLVLGVVLALGPFLAWLNFRTKRGDIRGANRVAAFVFAASWLGDLLGAHHVASLNEMAVFFVSAIWAMPPAFCVWVFYLALEPYARRRSPQIMITWSRVLSGGFRDPLVGGHLLFGVAMGVGLALQCLGFGMALEHYGTMTANVQLPLILDARRMIGGLPNALYVTILIVILNTFALILLRKVLRRQWLAVVAFAMIASGAGLVSPHPAISVVSQILASALYAAILFQFGGLLPMIMGVFVGNILVTFPLTTDFSSWYADSTVFVLVVVLALTAFAFHTAVAGRPLFKAGFLEPD